MGTQNSYYSESEERRGSTEALLVATGDVASSAVLVLGWGEAGVALVLGWGSAGAGLG